jgi:hypothetical protein
MVQVLSMVDGKIMQWMLSAHIKVHNWSKVGCKNTCPWHYAVYDV